MARPTKAEKALKIKALKWALEELKKKSTYKNNLLNYQDVVDLANSSEWAESFKAKIHVQSIKNPKTDEYMEIRDSIRDYKKEFNKSKKNIGSANNQIIEGLEEKIGDLTIKIAALLDNEIKLKKEIENEKRAKEKLREEKNRYLKKLEEVQR